MYAKVLALLVFLGLALFLVEVFGAEAGLHLHRRQPRDHDVSEARDLYQAARVDEVLAAQLLLAPHRDLECVPRPEHADAALHAALGRRGVDRRNSDVDGVLRVYDRGKERPDQT